MGEWGLGCRGAGKGSGAKGGRASKGWAAGSRTGLLPHLSVDLSLHPRLQP